MISNQAQVEFWNGPAGEGWVKGQDMFDGMMEAMKARLVEVVKDAPARHVLDIGCGTGATTLAVMQALGEGADCTGLDISEPMLDAARRRAAEAGADITFIRADAQTHTFTPGYFDTIVSRFGIMFFEDPVAAFRNLRAAAAPGARLRCLAWRSIDENPFMSAAEDAARPLLPDLPPRQTEGPGQFGFADADRTRQILADSGWTGIEITPEDFPSSIPEAALTGFLTKRGAVGAALQALDEERRARVVKTIRAAFDTYVHGDEVRFTSACWMISAEAPA